MKIAILSFYSGINRRGVETWTYEIANLLRGKHQVVVFQNGLAEKDSKYEIISLSLHYERNKKEKLFALQKRAFLDYKSRKIALFTLKILPKLWKGNFDIIIPTDGGWEPAFVRILTWLKRRKMIVVGHAGIGWDDKNNLWCFPDCFVALSSFAKIWAKKVNPFVKIEYISDGVDLQKFNPVGEKTEIDLVKPIVMAVGALERTKRIDLIIKAVSKMGNASLLVVGRGELKGEIGTLGKKLLGKRFLLKEFDHNDMPKVYRTCDVFVSASLPYFSFEMVILEAMATKLPVVANDDAIRREIVGNAGVFVDPTDTDSFAKDINDVINIDWGDELRKQAEKFSWDIILDKYENLFKELVKSKH